MDTASTDFGMKIAFDFLKINIERIWKYYKLGKEEEYFELGKKNNTEVVKNNIYNSLNEEVFVPLNKKLLESISQGYFIPIIKFDPLNVRKSAYFSEGFEHLKQDINGFDKDFEWIGKAVKGYNNALKKFEKNELYDLISTYFEQKSFKVIHNVIEYTKENSIRVTELIPKLKQCWYEKDFSFNYGYKNGYLKTNNGITIAKVSKDHEKEMDVCIEDLKNYEEICITHMNLVNTYNNIINKAQKLSKEIKKNTIMSIKSGTYNTTCEECAPKYLF
jgi:hypothetical protein